MSSPSFAPAIDLALIADPPDNPNRMREQQYKMLVHAIRTEGFLQPVLLRLLTAPDAPEDEHDAYEIIDGVHRVRAARDALMQSVPAVVLPYGTSDAEARVLQLGLNRLRGELDLTDVARIAEELTVLSDDLLQVSGFTRAELDGLVAATVPPEVDLEDGMELPEPAPASDEAGRYMLEVELESAAELRAAKRALRRAGGRGNKDLAAGLRMALGLDS